jgi:arylsulfatase A-like enzyme
MKLLYTALLLFFVKISFAQNKPNVLFIATDDLNDWVTCLGDYPNVKTPNIDRLANRGILFTNAHCQAPICGPSRASIMTSLYPSTTGVYLQLSDDQLKGKSKAISKSTFLPDYFEKFGYETWGVGKLFHDGDRAKSFQHYGGFYPYGSKLQKSKKRMNYDSAWFTSVWKTMTDWGPLNVEDSDMCDYQIAKWGVDVLNQKHDKPFFLGVGFTFTHTPWQLPKKWIDMFPLDDMVTPPYNSDDMKDISEMSKRIHYMPEMPTAEWLIESGKWKSLIQSYLASIAFVDAQIGRLLDALDSSSYADNTIIVLFSDHGYHFGEKNRVCKHSLWERSTHVPLIFAGGNIKSNIKCDAPVGLIDIYPTLVDLCGLEKNVQNEGMSLCDLISNPEHNSTRPAITTYGKGNTSLFNGRYHFIQYEDGSQELYDSKKDPNEWYNLAEIEKYSKEIKKLQKYLPKHYEPYLIKTRMSRAANPYFNEKKCPGYTEQVKRFIK